MPASHTALVCNIVNLQRTLGGAEVYTMSFARAARATGCRVVLYVNRAAGFWSHLAHDDIAVVAVADAAQVLAGLAPGAWIVTQAPVPASFVEAARALHRLTGFCHMPLTGRHAGVLARYHQVYAVSDYVASTLAPAGVDCGYREPLYGIAEFARGADGGAQPIHARSPYSWDRRKWRDRALSLLAPLAGLASRPARFERKPGSLVLGIVSGIGPIKQFDVLFGLIAGHIARHADVVLEVFGHGGYRSVADFRKALGPLRSRTRFWGHQDRPGDIYPSLDFLMAGLPEKEALGLNVLEAQALGVPVLAVDAAPFTETVRDGVTGLFYPDPRGDGGAGFARVFERARAGFTFDRAAARDHLAKFSPASFAARVARLVAAESAGATLPVALPGRTDPILAVEH